MSTLLRSHSNRAEEDVMSIAWLTVCVLLGADDTEPAAPAVKPSPWTAIATAHVDDYELTAPDGGDALTRVPGAVCQHVQSVRGNATGSVFVWTDETGRPAAVCDVFFLPKGAPPNFELYDEWHSLTSKPLLAQWQGRTRWSPDEPGLDWKAIPKVPESGSTPEVRHRQARTIARRFTAQIVNRAGDRYELRMLPTPIFQFDTQGSMESRGGAVFAFCQGNDPEVLLVLEERLAKGDGDEVHARWEYAAAAMSNLDQYVQLDGEAVWQAAPPSFSSTGRHTGGPLRLVQMPVE
jgi:hypothetical protein